MRKIMINVLIYIPLLAIGQKSEMLHDKLWQQVDECYQMFVDMDDDGTPDFDKIDDARNGYLHISGEWPSCACSCSATVGAYKNRLGEYTILQSEEENCNWEKKIVSNRTLRDVLPEHFGLNNFLEKNEQNKLDYAVFYANMIIPQYGTDTKVHFELVPFGMRPQSDSLLCFEYEQDDSCTSLISIKNIAKNVSDYTLQCLIEGEFEKISYEDSVFIMNDINKPINKTFSSVEDIKEQLKPLHYTFSVYQNLKTDEICLGWNKNTSRFYVKEIGKKPTKISFKTFLSQYVYWYWIC